MRAHGLVALWLGMTAVSFWFFDGKYRLPVTTDRALSAIETLPEERTGILTGTEGARAVLVNFWNPECACSRFNEPYVRSLAERFQKEGVEIVTVIVNPRGSEEALLRVANARGIPGEVVIDREGAIADEYDILAAPAAVIFDGAGNPMYRGAYNVSRICTDPETAYAERTLVGILSGEKARLPSLPFYGCSLGR